MNDAERFSQAMSELDDRYIEEAAGCRRGPVRVWGPRVAAAAACLAVLVAGARLLPGQTPGESAATPPPFDPNLPRLTIQTEENGMGFEAYDAYDIDEIVSGNPWTEDLGLTTLPVYDNTVEWNQYQLPVDPDLEAMEERLRQVADRLGLDGDALTVTSDAPSEEQVRAMEEKWALTGGELPPEYKAATRLMAEAPGVELEVDPALTVTIWFEPGRELPEGYNFAFHATREETERVAAWLEREYADLLAMEEPTLALSGGDYNIYLQQGYSIAFYEGAGSETDRLLQYNFDKVEFSCNDEGQLHLIRVYGPDLSQKLGDYPLLTVAEAKELLAQGHYLTSVPQEMPGLDQVARVELAYRTGRREGCYMPYYRFYVAMDLEDYVMPDEDLQMFGVYYVPAVRPEYIENLPQWDGSFN